MIIYAVTNGFIDDRARRQGARVGEGLPRVHGGAVPAGGRAIRTREGAVEGHRGRAQARRSSSTRRVASAEPLVAAYFRLRRSEFHGQGTRTQGRIKSVENTRKITRTMEMVATSKMKRAPGPRGRGASVRRRARRRDLAPLLAGTGRAVSAAASAGRSRDGRRCCCSRRTAALPARSTPTSSRRRARSCRRLEAQGVEVELHVVGTQGRRLLPVPRASRSLRRAPTSPTPDRRRRRVARGRR